jgi:hypothetical protein
MLFLSGGLTTHSARPPLSVILMFVVQGGALIRALDGYLFRKGEYQHG